MYIFGKCVLGPQLSTPGISDYLQKFRLRPGAIFLCFAFFTLVPQTAQKLFEVQKTPKNDQAIIPIWRRSYININV